MNRTEKTVLLADDSPDIRCLVRSSCRQIPDLRVVAEATDGREALQLLVEHTPTIAVLGVPMPVYDGKVLLEEIRNRQLQTRVLLLTAYDHPEYFAPAFWSDAHGHLYAGDGLEDWMLPALKAVANGRNFASPTPLETLRKHHGALTLTQSRTGGHSLKRAEVELLTLTVRGKSDKEMATALDLPVRTVEKRKARLRRKLGVSSTVELAVFAATQHLCEI